MQDPPEGFVQNYCLLIGDRSFSNFQKVRVGSHAPHMFPVHPDPSTSYRAFNPLTPRPMRLTSQILDLKGTPRNDQAKLLDIFLSVTSSNSDLSDTSFLTSIDMDPHQDKSTITPSSSAMFSPGGMSRGNSLAGDEGRESATSTPKGFGDFRRLVSFATRRE